MTTTPSANIKDFDFGRDRHLWGNPPPSAAAMFIGDQLGGAGWLVKLSDGTENPYYVKLPKHIMDARLHLPEAPLEHRGGRLADNTLPTLGAAYLDYLSSLVDAARREFPGRRLI